MRRKAIEALGYVVAGALLGVILGLTLNPLDTDIAYYGIGAAVAFVVALLVRRFANRNAKRS
jgi:hypothetical protein